MNVCSSKNFTAMSDGEQEKLTKQTSQLDVVAQAVCGWCMVHKP